MRCWSPAAHVANIRAPMFVMHDVGDTLLPYTESRRLLDDLPAEVPRRYAEFHMFEHVYPKDPTQLLRFVPELVELYQHLYAVLLVLTD
jgi:dipeptidyl aminopeptidase/acylaminoacyl peptidase